MGLDLFGRHVFASRGGSLTMPGMAMKRDLTPQQLRTREMMEHVHPAYDRATVDFVRIAIGTGILCVECKACGKRAALTNKNCTHIHPCNKTEVRSVMFGCSRIDCGSTDVRRYAGCDLEESKMWLASDPMDPDREIPIQTKRNEKVGDGKKRKPPAVNGGLRVPTWGTGGLRAGTIKATRTWRGWFRRNPYPP